ncbi:MAG TPA: putative baseplate assembly protein [Blastocatellia bacterium]|nr:putative baseplate assembly protein [Blastocatellia bacterium]
MIYFCCDERRRNAVAHSALNGIDFLEVSDNPADPVDARQRTLFVHFVKPLTPGSLTEKNLQIDGGERIRNIKVVTATIGGSSSPPLSSPPANDARVLAVEVSEAGDFSTYTLRLVQHANHPDPPAGFDRILSSIQFSFKALCPSDLDCKRERVCPDEPAKEPEINYLAKDFASFRQLMLDRMTMLAPNWKERNAADLGIALVEVLAYVGDYLSYQQDAVATEAYLRTARRRASVRRHARLIDYPMHDGRNARVWVQLLASAEGNGLTIEPGSGAAKTKLLTRVDGLPDSLIIAQKSATFAKALSFKPRVFELKHEITIFEAHNLMKFYTWGARECCLPKGATSATLDGSLPNLEAGHVLIFEEKRGAKTGVPGDANPLHRWAVRLTEVTVTSDLLGGQFNSPPDNTATPVTEIKWSRGDALPFALCVSAVVGTRFHDDVSVALGNIVLADHGMTFTDQPENISVDLDTVVTSLDPGTVPESSPPLTRITASIVDRCDDPTVERTPPRYRPRLKHSPLTQTAPYDPSKPPESASATMKLSFSDPQQLPRPAITLVQTHAPETWKPARDLLGSRPTDPQFVVEVETDGATYLRFGNGQSGMRPAEGTRFLATYRIGNGAAGNVGADAISHLVSSDPAVISDLSKPLITGVRSPIPATGGVDPETIEHVRQNAPSAFRRQERAVTPADFEEIAVREDVVERCGLDVQRAAATVRWTGSWHTMFLTIDRLGGEPVDTGFEQKLRSCLERYRMAGQDLEVDGPSYVSLEIEMVVCLTPGYFFGDVETALLQVFSNRLLPDGRRGVFHPDNFTFGQPVFLSSIFAAAQAVTGVDSINVTKFQRQGIDSDQARKTGRLEIARLEIARLDNDPNFPEHGVFTLKRG